MAFKCLWDEDARVGKAGNGHLYVVHIDTKVNGERVKFVPFLREKDQFYPLLYCSYINTANFT